MLEGEIGIIEKCIVQDEPIKTPIGLCEVTHKLMGV